jgi:hypothetical protein
VRWPWIVALALTHFVSALASVVLSSSSLVTESGADGSAIEAFWSAAADILLAPAAQVHLLLRGADLFDLLEWALVVLNGLLWGFVLAHLAALALAGVERLRRARSEV